MNRYRPSIETLDSRRLMAADVGFADSAETPEVPAAAPGIWLDVFTCPDDSAPDRRPSPETTDQYFATFDGDDDSTRATIDGGAILKLQDVNIGV